ncbi:MAG: hypothetical protein ACE5I4_01095 [Thermoplasmata archaeon]
MLLSLLLATLFQPHAHGSGVGLRWQTETVEQGSPNGLFTSLSLDATGRPHIAYIDGGADTLKYAVLTEPGWEIEQVAAQGGFHGQTNLVLDDQGRPHIAYYEGRTGFLMYATRNGSVWDRHRVERTSFGGPNGLAVDALGTVHLAYSFLNSRLRYGQWTGTDWSIEEVDAESLAVRHVSLALDPESRPHIAYHGFPNLRYAIWTGTQWQIEDIELTPEIGLYVALAVDSVGSSHVAYRDPLLRDLKYARRDQGVWSVETVDAFGDAGWFASIALDEEDAPHVAYYERLRSELRHARRLSVGWFVEEVDSQGVVGWYPSIAVDGETPHVSYHDWSGGSLRYAAGAPELAIRTLPASGRSQTEVVLRGDLLALGELDGADVFFEWRPEGQRRWRSLPAGHLSAEGVYEAVLPDLAPDHEYEFRARAHGLPNVVAVGETLDFRTLAFVDQEAIYRFQVGTTITISVLVGLLLLWFALLARRSFRDRRWKGRPRR